MLHWVHMASQTESNQASMGVWESLIPVKTFRYKPKMLSLGGIFYVGEQLTETAIPEKYMQI